MFSTIVNDACWRNWMLMCFFLCEVESEVDGKTVIKP